MLNRTARHTRLTVAALASTLLITACASSDSDDSKSGSKDSQAKIYAAGIVGSQPTAGTPKSGGTLEVIEYSEARSLDPTVTIANGAAGGNALAAVYDVLMTYDGTSGTYKPLLAESLTTTDSITWTLKLRDGVKFIDNTPLNADAVLGSINYYMTNYGFNTALLASGIKDMVATDDLTVTFTLNSAWATFDSMFAQGPGMILAPASYAKGKEAFKAVGAGPFKFDNYSPAEELVLIRNDSYWGEKAQLDKIRFSWVQADQAKLDSLKGGAADLISIRTPGVVEGARKDNYPGAMTPTGTNNIVWINNRDGHAGADERIRQAINLALDGKQYLERAQGGAGVPTKSLFSEAYAYNKAVELPEQDLAKAKELVAEAKADGAKTKLTFIGQSDQASQTGAVTLEAQLEAVGLDIEVELLRDVTEQVNRIYVSHNFDLAMGAMSISEDPYMSLVNNATSTSASNPAGYANKEMDALIAELQAKQPVEAADTLAKINELWQETVPGAVLAAGGFFSPWNKNVHGVQQTAATMLLFHDAWKS